MNVCFHKERRQAQHSVPAQHRLGTCRCTHCDAFATRSNTSLLIHVPITMYSRSAKGLSIDSHHHSHLVRRSLWGSFSIIGVGIVFFTLSSHQNLSSSSSPCLEYAIVCRFGVGCSSVFLAFRAENWLLVATTYVAVALRL